MIKNHSLEYCGWSLNFERCDNVLGDELIKIFAVTAEMAGRQGANFPARKF